MMNENGTGTTMLMQPAGYGGGLLNGGNDILWLLLGGMFFGGGIGGWGGGYGGDGMYPWIQNGFQDQQLNSQLIGIQNGLTAGFPGVVAAVNGAQNALAQQIYGNVVAELNRSFAEQTANVQGFNAVQGKLAECCCNNNLATVQTQNIVQTEGAATRAAIQNVGQAILDKMCSDKIDAKNEKIVEQANRISALEANNYIQNAVTAQTQYLLDKLQPATTTGAGA